MPSADTNRYLESIVSHETRSSLEKSSTDLGNGASPVVVILESAENDQIPAHNSRDKDYVAQQSEPAEQESTMMETQGMKLKSSQGMSGMGTITWSELHRKQPLLGASLCRVDKLRRTISVTFAAPYVRSACLCSCPYHKTQGPWSCC